MESDDQKRTKVAMDLMQLTGRQEEGKLQTNQIRSMYSTSFRGLKLPSSDRTERQEVMERGRI